MKGSKFEIFKDEITKYLFKTLTVVVNLLSI